MKLFKMSNFTFFSMFSIQSPLIAKFQLSSAASLNLGWSQNGVLGNGLSCFTVFKPSRESSSFGTITNFTSKELLFAGLVTFRVASPIDLAVDLFHILRFDSLLTLWDFFTNLCWIVFTSAPVSICICITCINPSQTSPGFYVSAVQVF